MAAAVAVYCITWLKGYRGIEQYDRHAPWAVPTATVSGILAMILCVELDLS